MPRANRDVFGGLVWHYSHRCNQRTLPMKFARDRRRYLSDGSAAQTAEDEVVVFLRGVHWKHALAALFCF